MIDVERLKWDREYWDEVAPEGANRYYDRPHYQCFLKHSSPDHLYHLSSGEWCPIPHYAIHSHLNSSFPRPEPRQVEWDSGMPELGSGVECWMSGDTWSEGSVIALDEYDGNTVAVCRVQGFYYPFTEKCLRPIRTKQQSQREELASLIKYEAWQAKYFCTGLADAILAHYNLEPKK